MHMTRAKQPNFIVCKTEDVIIELLSLHDDWQKMYTKDTLLSEVLQSMSTHFFGATATHFDTLTLRSLSVEEIIQFEEDLIPKLLRVFEMHRDFVFGELRCACAIVTKISNEQHWNEMYNSLCSIRSWKQGVDYAFYVFAQWGHTYKVYSDFLAAFDYRWQYLKDNMKILNEAHLSRNVWLFEKRNKRYVV